MSTTLFVSNWPDKNFLLNCRIKMDKPQDLVRVVTRFLDEVPDEVARFV